MLERNFNFHEEGIRVRHLQNVKKKKNVKECPSIKSGSTATMFNSRNEAWYILVY
jgi:hypothetical protein